MASRFDRSWGWTGAVAVLAAAVLALAAGQARAASYPGGGSGFTGGPEGWTPGPASCSVPVLCNANAGYDGANGNPPGSLALNTNILLNALGLVTSNATFVSPDFVAKEGGSATLSLERQIGSSNILDLAPQGSYTVTLIDRTSGVSTAAITDTVTSAETAFAGKNGGVKVVDGHTYAIEIAAQASSSLANLGLFGSTALRFDNVALTVGTTGGGGGGGGGGGNDGKGGGGAGGGSNAGAMTNRQLTQLIQGNGLPGSAVLRGNRLIVKAKCPARVGRACRVTVQGLVKRGRPATNRRLGNIGKGKSRKFVLRVKPKQRAKVRGKQRLLFKQTVKAGKAKATVYKRLKLVKPS